MAKAKKVIKKVKKVNRLNKLIKLASSKNLNGFRKTLKEVLAKKVAKKLDEKELEISKKLFKDKK